MVDSLRIKNIIEKRDNALAKVARRNSILYYCGWILVWITLSGVVGSMSLLYSKKITRPDIMFGEWVELDAPPYDTEVFKLTQLGVEQHNRIISTEFEFSGSEISYYRGNQKHSYQIIDRNKTLIRRTEPKPYGVFYAKRGSEEYEKRTAPVVNQRQQARFTTR